MQTDLAIDIARAWNGCNAYALTQQFALPARCVYTAILMLDAELTWLLSLQQACVELSPKQTERLAVLLDLFPEANQPQQDPISGKAARRLLVGAARQCLSQSQHGGTSQSTSQGPRQ
ncbi:hypothetical protein [Comamonas sp.]|uniref:hypothetical protein n=1 Tax=Comamonas sp. TaxID=34028 RepID=UPI003A936E95